MFKVGEQTSGGQVVLEILAESEVAIVYITTDKHLRWHYMANNGKLPVAHQSTIIKFDALFKDIKLFVPKKHQLTQFTLLGKCLHSALQHPDPLATDDLFAEVREGSSALSLQAVRLRYVGTCLATLFCAGLACGLISLVLPLEPQWADLLPAGAFGAAGAAVSILHRVRSLEIDWRTTLPALTTEAVSRILVGLFFGMFFVMASKANLVLGALKDIPFGLFVFAIVAGFSERFVPQLIDQLENRPIDAQPS